MMNICNLTGFMATFVQRYYHFFFYEKQKDPQVFYINKFLFSLNKKIIEYLGLTIKQIEICTYVNKKFLYAQI